MSDECGCKIVIEKTPVALGFDAKRKIVYCPLHAAASELLEALANIVACRECYYSGVCEKHDSPADLALAHATGAQP